MPKRKKRTRQAKRDEICYYLSFVILPAHTNGYFDDDFFSFSPQLLTVFDCVG